MGKIPQHTRSAPFLLSLFLFVFWASSCNFYWEETTHFGQEWTALILVQLKRKKKRCKNLFTTRQGICTENLCLPQALWSIFQYLPFQAGRVQKTYFYHQGLIWLWSICTLKWLLVIEQTQHDLTKMYYTAKMLFWEVKQQFPTANSPLQPSLHCTRDLGGHF